MPTHAPNLLLASSSPARRMLLERLGLPFRCQSPEVDETPLPEESAEDLVRRLSEAKARALQAAFPDCLIIGSDQALQLDGVILGKPGRHDAAVAQLKRLSGRTATFHTGLCLLNVQANRLHLLTEPFTVHFRDLDKATIERYLQAEEPYGCAGSFKAEGLGISLFRRFEGRDPSSLIGLPLMALVDMLRAEGVSVP